MVATIGVGFHTNVTTFTELLLADLYTNQTVFLPIEILAITAFGVVISLDARGCIGILLWWCLQNTLS